MLLPQMIVATLRPRNRSRSSRTAATPSAAERSRRLNQTSEVEKMPHPGVDALVIDQDDVVDDF